MIFDILSQGGSTKNPKKAKQNLFTFLILILKNTFLISYFNKMYMQTRNKVCEYFWI